MLTSHGVSPVVVVERASLDENFRPTVSISFFPPVWPNMIWLYPYLVALFSCVSLWPTLDDCCAISSSGDIWNNAVFITVVCLCNLLPVLATWKGGTKPLQSRESNVWHPFDVRSITLCNLQLSKRVISDAVHEIWWIIISFEWLQL